MLEIPIRFLPVRAKKRMYPGLEAGCRSSKAYELSNDDGYTHFEVWVSLRCIKKPAMRK
jgi:hypothetical protein